MALTALGERDPGRLEPAISAFRKALTERTRDRVPLDWAATQANLGQALAALGASESGTARLEEAVQAYRLALQERTRDHAPLDWAVTQTDLAEALTALAARDPAAARPEEAVDALTGALAVFDGSGDAERAGRARTLLDRAQAATRAHPDAG